MVFLAELPKTADDSSMWNLVISGIIGGIISLILFPVVKFYLVRSYNRCRLLVEVENNLNYRDIILMPLRVTNRSASTLKNVIGFISLEFNEQDISTDYNDETIRYVKSSAVQPMMLSWGMITDRGISPSMDINEEQTADLNLFRYWAIGGRLQALEIASENGFSDVVRGVGCRVILKAWRDYRFTILITADNMKPYRKEFQFDNVDISIDEI